MAEAVVEAAAAPFVEAASAAPGDDYSRGVEDAIVSSQEKIEKRESRNTHKRIAAQFEEFRKGRPLCHPHGRFLAHA